MYKVSELHFNLAYLKQISLPESNRSLSASASLKPIQEIKGCYISMDTCNGQWHKADSGSNHFYERPGYEATYLVTLEQIAEVAAYLSL